MGIVSLPSFGSDPATITAAGLDGKVDPLATEFNGSVDNDNIKANAGIVYSKLNLTGSVVYADLSGTALSAIDQTLVMSGKAINMAKGSDIASATTTDIGAMTGNYGDVTGTTTITGLGTVQAGTVRFVRFTGALTLTHSGTALLLPTAANITTAANDTAAFVSLGSGNWKCLWYQRYSGAPLVSGYTPTAANALAGSVIQVLNTQSGAVSTGTTVMPIDDSIPQSGEGDEKITRAITPNSATNKLRIDVTIYGSPSAGGRWSAALFQDATAGALAAGISESGNNNEISSVKFTHYMDAGTTSSTTFKVRAGVPSAGTLTFNGESGARLMGGVLASSITVTEIKV